MKNETQPQPQPQPTIAELWDRFVKLENYIETEKILQSWGTKGSDGLSHDGRNHTADEKEIKAIRTQLIERCNPLFEDKIMPDRPSKALWAEFHREMSAYHAFWAWELEQRQKEATPPPVIP